MAIYPDPREVTSNPLPAAVLPDDDVHHHDDAPADWWIELEKKFQNFPAQASDNRPDHSLTGRRLARLVRKSTTTADRVLLALRLEQEGLRRPTRAQAAALVGVSASYVGTAARFSAEERRQLGCGQISLASVHNRRGDSPTDTELDRLVRKCPDRVMDALDRYTQPGLFPAE